MTPRVAISADFLKAFDRLGAQAKKKVRTFLEKFRRDPTSAALNYEKINGMLDDKVRTARVDQQYRAIVIHPPRGDVYLCVWVDNHDEAMDWARNRRFEVNPHVGSLQVYTVQDGEAEAPVPVEEPVPEARLLSGVRNRELLACGVPESLVPSVRALRTDDDLDELAEYLPKDAADALYMLAAGETMQAVHEMLCQTPDQVVDIEDFSAALEQPASRQSFLKVEGDEVLSAMLNAPLEQWRVFLHPKQQQIVNMRTTGPARVLGGAGTGKTVVLMHRAVALARDVFDKPEDRLLVTTFTRNLALDIESHIAQIGPDVADRIDVMNLHGWAMRFLRKQGAEVHLADDALVDRLWTDAIENNGGHDYPASFYREELQHVIQALGIRAREDYLRASRAGRGTPLNRRARLKVWPVIAAYRQGLEAAGKVELTDAAEEARRYLESNPEQVGYRAVLADEVQDFGAPELRLLRAIVPPGNDDLFLVGDAHQRIYRRVARLSHCGIEARGRRSRKLRVNYRTTRSIKRWSEALLKGADIDDLDGGEDELNGYRSLRDGPAPTYAHANSADAEARQVVDMVKSWLQADIPANHICLGARTRDLVRDRYLPLLASAGIEAVEIRKDGAPESDGVRVATFHRLKGLEFTHVLLAGVNAQTLPLALPDSAFPDTASREDHIKSERCLAYVAATRARDELVVTGFGDKSPLLG